MDDRSLTSLEFDRLRQVLAQYADSGQAREILTHLKPLGSLGEVQSELNRVEEIRGFLQRGGSYPGGGVTDVQPLLKKASVSGSLLEADELLAVLKNLRVFAFVRKMLDRERTRIPLVYQLLIGLRPLPELETAIERVVSPEGVVKDSASPELNRLRKAIAEATDALRARLSAIAAKLSKQGVLREESATLRDGRFVLPVRSDAMGKIKGIVHDRSATGGTLFVEPTSLVEAGNELRMLELAEQVEVRRILRELTALARSHIEQIWANLRAMIALDCLWAKARFAEKLDAVKPVIVEDGAINILSGRHPLLALTEGREVVPLTLELGADYHTLVISGPNAGGKSVALKCVGLLCLMAASGLPVPALPGTELPQFEAIMADIGDQQSIQDDLSTFTAHAARLKEILEKANPRTLVLIDEIGAGTDPQEGASLSIAALEQLTARRCPTIVTTHHSALKAFAHSTTGCANGSMEFDRDTFRPTYRFKPHIPGSSYALDIARRAGLADVIVARARELLGGERTALEDMVASLSEKISRYDALLIDERKQKELLAAQEESYRQKLERLQMREREIKQRSAQELEELLKAARKTIEATVKELREKNADKLTIKKAHSELERLRSEAKLGLGLPVVDVPQPPNRTPVIEVDKPKDPVVGVWVKIDDSAVGQVTALSARGERLCVAVGGVQLWVTRPRVKVVEPPTDAPPVSRYHTLPEVPFELDVRGLDGPEALQRVDKYLYDGYMSGRSKLGIIHGKGMGILSRNIQKFLKNHSLVKSYRFGEYGEGDYGVTIVELKT